MVWNYLTFSIDCRDLRWSSCVSRTRTRRRRFSAGAASDDALLEGDVVEYPLPLHVQQGGKYGSRCYGVGAVTELTSQDASILCHLEPLVMVNPWYPAHLQTFVRRGRLKFPEQIPALRRNFAADMLIQSLYFSSFAKQDDSSLPHWIVDEHQDPLVIPITEVIASLTFPSSTCKNIIKGAPILSNWKQLISKAVHLLLYAFEHGEKDTDL